MKNVIVKTVDGEKVYKCPYCGKESRYGQRVQSHIHICEKLEADKSIGYWRTGWNRSPATDHYDI